MAATREPLRLELAATRAEVGRALDELRRACAAWAAPVEVTDDLCLAADEVLANVVLHAYAGDPAGRAWLECRPVVDGFELEVLDRAAAFDPLAAAPAAIGDERAGDQVGGLGIHLLRAVMDDIRYTRVDGENRLLLHRRLRDNEPAA